MRRPPLSIAIAINRAVRSTDEWFDEPDDLARVVAALRAIDHINDPVSAAAVLLYRVTRAQGFGEGNKRTAFLLAPWVLDRNGRDGARLMPPDDRNLADLLIRAAAGSNRAGRDHGAADKPYLGSATPARDRHIQS